MAPSLRERNRLRVRLEIQQTAWRLFAEHGYAEVSTTDIAVAAGVSTSTYFRHVPAKEELLLQPLLASSAGIVADFAARPDDEPIRTALASVIRSRTAEADTTALQAWRAAMLSAPEVGPRVTLIAEDDRAELVRIAASRLPPGDEADLRAGLSVHLVLAAAEFAYRHWIGSRRQVALLEVMDATLSADPTA